MVVVDASLPSGRSAVPARAREPGAGRTVLPPVGTAKAGQMVRAELPGPARVLSRRRVPSAALRARPLVHQLSRASPSVQPLERAPTGQPRHARPALERLVRAASTASARCSASDPSASRPRPVRNARASGGPTEILWDLDGRGPARVVTIMVSWESPAFGVRHLVLDPHSWGLGFGGRAVAPRLLPLLGRRRRAGLGFVETWTTAALAVWRAAPPACTSGSCAC